MSPRLRNAELGLPVAGMGESWGAMGQQTHRADKLFRGIASTLFLCLYLSSPSP